MSNNKKTLVSCLLIITSLFSLNLFSETYQLGDLAPRGAPDGQLNAADALILERIILGDIEPTNEELLIGDVAPFDLPDGLLNVGDLVVQQRAILGLVNLGTVTTAPPIPAAPTINPVISPSNENPYLISGNAEAGSNVSVYVNGSLLVTALADLSTGDYSFFIALNEGDNFIYTTSTNTSGVSPQSEQVLVYYQLQDGGTLSGAINSSVTLSKNTVYTIPSNLTIQFGANLIIEQGAKLNFETGAGLIVNGTLTVTGTVQNRAVFTSNIAPVDKSMDDWPGITVESGGEVYIDYAVVEYAFLGIQFNDGSNGVISNAIVDTNVYGVYFNHGSGGTVINSLIENNSAGIYILGATTSFIGPNNVITQNNSGIYFEPHYDYSEYISTNPFAVIRGNKIYDNNMNLSSSYFENDRYDVVDVKGNYWGSVDVNIIASTMGHPTTSSEPFPYSYPVYDFTEFLDENDETYIHSDNFLLGPFREDTRLEENTTYVALSTLEVTFEKTLTIPQGVTIKFVPNSAAGFDVEGTLNIEGAEGSPVLLTSNSLEKASGDWQGIREGYNGTINIYDAIIEYANNGVYFLSGSGVVTNSTIQNNVSGILLAGSAEASVTNSLIQNNENGVYINDAALSSIGPENLITNNTVGLFFNGSQYTTLTATVRENIIFDNTDNNVVAAHFPADGYVLDLQRNYWGTVDVREMLLSLESYRIYNFSVIYDVVTYDVSGFLDENGVANTAIPLYGVIDGSTSILQNETYLVIDSLEIPVGVELTIPKGVTFELAHDDFEVDVKGTLNITGSAGELVRFSSNRVIDEKASGDWKGIIVEDGAVVNIDFALIEFSSTGIYFNQGSSGTVTNSSILNNYVGIHTRGNSYNANKNPRPVVTNNSIYDNLSFNYFTEFYNGTVNIILHATNNWWGTTDALAIEQTIGDWNDDASNKVIVDSSDYLARAGGGVYAAHELQNCPVVRVTDDRNYEDIYPDDNIAWIGSNYTDVEEIERAFNNARTIDNSVFQYLKLPAQIEWDAMTVQQQGLYLINSERQARGIKPYEGISQNVAAITQIYADYVRTNNQIIDHYNDGKSPMERLDEDLVIRDNRDASIQAENGYEAHGNIPVPLDTESVTRAVYWWTYYDKFPLFGNAWGHRDTILRTGLTENSGETYKEGLIGFGISTGEYNPDSNNPPDSGAIVYINIIDPSSTWDYSTTQSVDTDAAQQCNNRIVINIDETAVPVNQIKKLKLSPSDLYLTPGSTTQLKVVATYLDDTQQDITSSTSFVADNLSVVDINAGTITALKAGYVYAVAEANGATSNSLYVSVNEQTDTSNLNGTYAESYLAYVPDNASIDSYDPKALSVFTGFVNDKTGAPLDDVTISVHSKPEYGSVKTDINGRFVFAVAAGEQKFVYRKTDYLTLHRSAISASNSWTVVDDVIMLEVDVKQTAISLSTSTPQTHTSTVVTDSYGSRSTTLVFNGISSATITSTDGGTRPITEFSVRATEYELPQSMPADLPKESAFTYCSELEVVGVRDDEQVTFDNPVVMYVDNFLGFGSGEVVPIGYYDRALGDWVASENGIVVKLLDTDSNGSIDGLDINDDNIADDLNQNGRTDDEVAGIENYPVGASYWRGSFDHFTPQDFNWPFIPPADATGRGDFNAETSNENKEQKELECTGSYVKPETQAFHEDIPITGTNLTLHYSSQRTKGYKHKFNVQVSGDIISPSMLEMIVKLNIGGNEFEQTFAPAVNKETEFIWDGTNPVGNRIKGVVHGLISIGFKYNTEYSSAGSATTPAEFALIETAWANIGANSTGVSGRDEFISWSSSSVSVQNTFDNQLANGWSLSNHHQSSSIGNIYKGDGEVIDINNSSKILRTGIQVTQHIGDDGYYQKGGSDIDYEINTNGTLTDKVTGLEWQYINVPERFRSLSEASDYCSIASFTSDTADWRLPTNKEIIYTIDKSGGSHNYPIYMFEGANHWSTSTLNVEDRLLSVICVRGESINTRYIADLKRDNSLEVVVDSQNGLMWQDDVSTTTGTLDWTESIDHCENLDNAGYSDWRLPNINELSYTLPNTTFVNETSLPPGESWGPAASFRKPYWSSTPYPQDATRAWAMESIGYSSYYFDKSDLYNVRCVRDNIQSARSPYHFDNNGRHSETVDLSSGLTLSTFAYDTENKLRTITDRFGDAISITGDPAVDGFYLITTQDGYTTKLFIDANNDLTSVLYDDATDYSFVYGAGSLLESKTTPNGHVFLHQFDLEGNGRTIQTSDEEGGVWDFFSTRQGNSSALYGYTTAETNTYQTLRTIQSNGDVNKTTTLFDGTVLSDLKQADDLKQTQQSCGVTTVIDKVIDSKTKEPIPSVITITQPSLLESVTDISKTYAEAGADYTRQTITTTLNGKPSSVYTDSKTGQTVLTSAEGRTTTLNTDVVTLLLQSSQTPGLLGTTYTYDARGRQETITTGTRSTTFTYNPVSKGDVTYVTADDGKETHFEYDALGRVSAIVYPDTHRVENTYDDNGNLETKIIPTPATHSFTYNSVDKVKTQTRPKEGAVTAVTQYDYDKERKLLQITLPSANVISNSYTDGLLDFTSTPEGMIDYSYTCNSKIESITEGSETVTYGYDGSLLEDITYTGSLNEVISQTYNTDFNLNTLTYAGQTTILGYDDDGMLTSTNGYTITRNALNGLPEILANGTLLQTRGFNGYGEAETVTTKVNTQDVYDYTLNYNDLGKITSKIETLDDGTVNTYVYTYDDRRRLDTVTKNGALVEDYGYDANGNRILQTNTLRSISAESASYNLGDQLQTVGTTTYDYDADAYLKEKVTAAGTTTYQYSSQGRLVRVQTPDKLIEYNHNAIGNRVEKKVDGVVTEKYLWLDKTTLLATYDKDDVLLQRYHYTDGHTPNSFTQSSETYYIVTDHLGSPRAVTDSSGAIVKKLDYDGFGNVIEDSAPGFRLPFGFAGGLWDVDTGLVRFGFRDYDADVGRWTARDPIGFEAGDTNLYGYVFSDPVNFIDQTGESPVIVVGVATAVSFVAGGAISAANGGSFLEGGASAAAGTIVAGAIAVASANSGIAILAGAVVSILSNALFSADAAYDVLDPDANVPKACKAK